MSRLAAALALAGALAIAPAARAQQQDTGMRRPPRGALNRSPNAARRPMGPPDGAPMMAAPQLDVASMLLSHTGDFKLTDQQVTRLAAIARRTTERRQAMRASMDSMFAARTAQPGAAPGAPGMQGPPAAARALAEKMRDQAHTDLRDAIGVLTVDQQAMGWEMMARRGAAGGRMRAFGGPGAAMNGAMMRRGMGMPGAPQQRRPSRPEQ